MPAIYVDQALFTIFVKAFKHFQATSTGQIFTSCQLIFKARLATGTYREGWGKNPRNLPCGKEKFAFFEICQPT